MGKIAVLKFGGTSLSNSQKIQFASHRIKFFLKKYRKLLVVLSAPADITDDLLKISSKFLPDDRSLDMLLSTGENISISIMNMALNAIKIKSIALNQYQAKIITTSNYRKARIISIDKTTIQKLFKKYNVIIIPGFIGIDKKMNITTLGRGGSDYTAVYLSTLFRTDCYLLSDIKGVYSSNPSKTEYARKLDEISYKELFEISKIDFAIRQTKAMGYAMKKNIKLHLGSSIENTKPTVIKNYNYFKKPKIKYISVNREKDKTLLYFIGENIKTRKDIIYKLKHYNCTKLKIQNNKLIFIFDKILDRDFIKKIYNDFILK